MLDMVIADQTKTPTLGEDGRLIIYGAIAEAKDQAGRYSVGMNHLSHVAGGNTGSIKAIFAHPPERV